MGITCNTWTTSNPGSRYPILYQGYVPDSGLQVDENGEPLRDPTTGDLLGIHNVNATGTSEEEMRGYIVESWNRNFPDQPKELADFDFVVVSGGHERTGP